MTRYQQASRPGVIRIPGWTIGLALMIVSAAIVLFFVILPALAWLFSLADYIQSAP